MRLYLKERRTRGVVRCCAAGNPGTLGRKTCPGSFRGNRRSLRSGRDDKERVTVPERVDAGQRRFSLPWVVRRPMAPPVEMTILFVIGSAFPGEVRGTADPYTARRDRSARPGTLFIFRCSLRPESSQEHLPTSIAEVLRLRAIKPSVCDNLRSASLRMTALFGGLKYSWLDMQKTRKDRKSHRLSG
jgi:hypothetical protein